MRRSVFLFEMLAVVCSLCFTRNPSFCVIGVGWDAFLVSRQQNVINSISTNNNGDDEDSDKRSNTDENILRDQWKHHKAQREKYLIHVSVAI